MRTFSAAVNAILFAIVISTISQGQDFSADIQYLDGITVSSKPGAAHASPVPKLYVSKDKIRLETNGLTGSILVVNKEENTAATMYPAKKAYQLLASGPSQYFRVDTVDNACPDWQKSAEQMIVCEKVGPETVNGRETVKYRNKAASDTVPIAVWIDKGLKFVIKWEGAGSGAELRNIKEGPQVAALFSIPADYSMASPQKSKGPFGARK